jgi:rRNA maturation RNase YbeY
MTITIQNNQTKHPVEIEHIQQLAEFLGQQLEGLQPDLMWNDITILLLDDDGITEPNRTYFGKDRATDVITFRYDPVPGEEGYDGDLLVNCQRAITEGPNHDGIQHELALYIAHGFDHLSGAEDYTDEARAAMRQTELGWLAKAEKLGLLNHLIGEA